MNSCSSWLNLVRLEKDYVTRGTIFKNNKALKNSLFQTEVNIKTRFVFRGKIKSMVKKKNKFLVQPSVLPFHLF